MDNSTLIALPRKHSQSYCSFSFLSSHLEKEGWKQTGCDGHAAQGFNWNFWKVWQLGLLDYSGREDASSVKNIQITISLQSNWNTYLYTRFPICIQSTHCKRVQLSICHIEWFWTCVLVLYLFMFTGVTSEVSIVLPKRITRHLWLYSFFFLLYRIMGAAFLPELLLAAFRDILYNSHRNL